MAKFSILLALVAGCVLAAPALADGSRRPLDPQNANLTNTPDVSTRFIVEFSEEASSRFRKRDGTPDTEGFFEKVKELGNNVIPQQSFTSELFHGASFEVVNGTDETLASLEELPDVARIWPVQFITLPKPTSQPDGDGSEEEDLAKRQVHPSPFIQKLYPHLLTRVEDVHAQSLDGSGVVVAVVDSGVNYNHPALGGGFGPGFKVEGGWDLVGPNYLPGDSELNPGPDPIDCGGHGSLVSGIIGSTEPKRIGVAPGATLRSYKVFGCLDGTTSDIVVAAFLMAFEEGADIISGSLGNDNGFAESPLAIIITKMAEQGVLVVTAAGNSGDDGAFYTSDGANAYGSLAVGSLHVRRQIAFDLYAKSSNGETRKMKYIPEKANPWDLPADTKANKGNLTRNFDLCNLSGTKPWRPWNGPDYPRNYKIPDEDVWVLKRGTDGLCYTGWQQMSSETMGLAQNILFWNVPDRPNESPTRNPQFNAAKNFATINYEDGQWIEDQFEAGYAVTFNFTDEGLEDVSASFSNDFSSWGTTLDARLVPQISAHGDSVWSTYLPRSPWLFSSGTSFSCPYVSGVAALFYQSVGGRAKLASCGKNPAEVARRRIINSGKTAGFNNYTSYPAALGQQGAGMIDAWKVVNYATSADPPIVHLNDTDHFTPAHKITVRNRSDRPVTYKITHKVGSTAMSRPFADAYIEFDTQIKIDVGLASVDFSTEELVVPAKSRATFTATFTEPDDVDPMILAQYGGEIYIDGDNDESIKIPYIGVRGSMKEAQVWETQHGVPIFLVSLENRTQFESGHVFSHPSLPLPYYDYLWSSREYSFDVVDADWSPSDWVYPPVPGKNKWRGSATFFDEERQFWRSYPIRLSSRSPWTFMNRLGGSYAHGGPVEPGSCRILARAVKTYGDFGKIEDWHTRLSHSFTVAAPVGNSTLQGKR